MLLARVELDRDLREIRFTSPSGRRVFEREYWGRTVPKILTGAYVFDGKEDR